MSKIFSENTQIVILAGGKGTRLSSINKGLPKSLTPILNVPILEHQIRFCRSQGFKNFLLVLCYKSELIKDYFKKNPIPDIKLNYFIENEAGGTGGALFSCLDLLEEIRIELAALAHLKKFSLLFIVTLFLLLISQVFFIDLIKS